MQKKIVFGIIITVVLLWGIGTYIVSQKEAGGIACTAEAKICPDGTGVGRTGPKCEFAPCPTTTATPTDGDMTLGIGETGSVGDITITLNAFVQDSRCPVDVVCIEAGAVNVNVTIKDAGHTETKNFPSDEVPYLFDGHYISIVSVLPPRQSKKEISKGEYHITFRVAIPKTQTAQDTLGSLVGTITVSPTCPVERVPEDPACAPKPYATLVDISGAHNFFIELHSDIKGMFRLQLPSGSYTITTRESTLYPSCGTKNVTVFRGSTTTANIICDSGIR